MWQTENSPESCCTSCVQLEVSPWSDFSVHYIMILSLEIGLRHAVDQNYYDIGRCFFLI